jgi:hypothetical protein
MVEQRHLEVAGAEEHVEPLRMLRNVD